MSIVSATKNYFKPNSYHKETSKETRPVTIQQTVTQLKLNKFVYNKILANSTSVPINSQTKWARDLDLGSRQQLQTPVNIDWKIAYSLSFSCTASTRLRTFHFKYLHRRITTNIFLAKCKLAPTDKCSFCKNEQETLVHLFLQCPFTKQFWQNVLNWINTYPGHENIELSDSMLLGLTNCKTVIPCNTHCKVLYFLK